jgi:hypothetical protein
MFAAVSRSACLVGAGFPSGLMRSRNCTAVRWSRHTLGRLQASRRTRRRGRLWSGFAKR